MHDHHETTVSTAIPDGRVSRRDFLRTSSAVTATAGILGLGSAAVAQAGGDAEESAAKEPKANVLLVHGAWADGSSWGGVIRDLLNHGHPVSAVQIALRSLADDVATTRRFLDTLTGPTLLVGHSYGGAVIGGAAFGAANAIGLVYVAAFAPEEGESLGQILAPFPALPSQQDIAPDPAGFLFIRQDRFPEDFAQDVPRPTAEVMAAVQKPLFGGIFGEPAGPQAWHDLPTFYQVSEHDRMLPTEAERFMAQRIGARTISLKTSHASLVSAPTRIAHLIREAARVSAG